MSDPTHGTIDGVNGNLIRVTFPDAVMQNEVGYALIHDLRLKAEIVRVRGRQCWLQVFEDTAGLKVGDPVAFSGELLSVELGPGILTAKGRPVTPKCIWNWPSRPDTSWSADSTSMG